MENHMSSCVLLDIVPRVSIHVLIMHKDCTNKSIRLQFDDHAGTMAIKLFYAHPIDFHEDKMDERKAKKGVWTLMSYPKGHRHSQIKPINKIWQEVVATAISCLNAFSTTHSPHFSSAYAPPYINIFILQIQITSFPSPNYFHSFLIPSHLSFPKYS